MPLGYWRLGERSGTIAHDETGNGNDGVYVGGPTLGVPGVVGDDDTAMAVFPGHLNLGDKFDFAGKAPFTYEFWIRTTGPFEDTCIFDKNSYLPGSGPFTRNNGQGLFGGSAWLSFERYVNNSLVSNSYLYIAQGELHHACITYDGTKLRAYVGASLTDSKNIDVPNPDTSTALLFGACAGGSFGPMQGILDEIAIYDYALPYERIAVHASFGR